MTQLFSNKKLLELKHRVIGHAITSKCEKRKVAAILVNESGVILSSGVNHSMDGECCEDSAGATKANVIHAEIACIKEYKEYLIDKYGIDNKPAKHDIPVAIIVSHNPCSNCLACIKNHFLDIEIIIAETFMKFDGDKIRYDLVPSEWFENDAKVLTAGAKKYKPNNWREVDDPARYYAAAMRHMQDFLKYIEGKEGAFLFDDGEGGIGTHHLANARVNLGFLLTLTETKEKADEIRSSFSTT